MNKNIILLIIYFILSYNVMAQNEHFFKKDQYCIDHQLGWRFYCDEEPKEEVEEQEIEGQSNKQTYMEKLDNVHKIVEEAKAKAVLEPTEENVKNYMYIQQKVLNQASYFSDMWRRIVWITPELDYSQKKPISNIGRNVYEEDKNNKMLDNLKNINKRYGIFFVYSSKCIFCQKYAQILYEFKNIYNLEIKGISIDGNFLPLWENNSFINQGQLEQLDVNYKTVPITILYDNLTNSAIVVGYGLMTHDELMSRIYLRTKIQTGEDY